MCNKLVFESGWNRIKRMLLYPKFNCVPLPGYKPENTDEDRQNMINQFNSVKRYPGYELDKAEEVCCGWCGNVTVAYHMAYANEYPNTLLNCGTMCLSCGRAVELSHQNWIRHFEYSDGCEITVWSDPRFARVHRSNVFGKCVHDEHFSLDEDEPILIWEKSDE